MSIENENSTSKSENLLQDESVVEDVAETVSSDSVTTDEKEQIVQEQNSPLAENSLNVEGDVAVAKPQNAFSRAMSKAGQAFDNACYKVRDWFKDKNNKVRWVILAALLIAVVVAIAVPAAMGTFDRVIFSLIMFIITPAIFIVACYKFPLLNKVGVVLFCYLIGMIVGNIPGLLPEGFTEPLKEGGTSMQQDIGDISVMLSLPLVLFSIDFKKWFKSAKKGLLCMLLACIAIVITALILTVTIGKLTPNAAHFGAMAVGVYTGGTPNIAAIKAALNISNDTFMQFQLYDTIFSLLYVLLLSTVARKILQKVFRLPAHPYMIEQEKKQQEELAKMGGVDPTANLSKKEKKKREAELKQKFIEEAKANGSDETIDAYADMVKPPIFRGLVVAFLLSAVILGISYLIAGAFQKINPDDSSIFMTVLVLFVTTFGILASFIKPIREIRRSFQLGMYVIYLFCFTIATMTDFSLLINIQWAVFGYVLLAILVSALIHAVLCSLFRIDSDTFIVTSISAILSPPFVPVVASSLKNKEVILTGLITGIIGYAIGNYLGIGVGQLLLLM